MKNIIAILTLLLASETFAQSSAQNLSMMAMTNACKECDLSNSQLVGVDFSGKDLTEANFSSSVADTANFSGARLLDVVLDGGSFKSANFDGAKIVVTYTHSTPNGNCSTCSSGVYQTDIDFRSAIFKNAQVNITVHESVFDGANFSGAKQVEINGDKCINLDPKFDLLNKWRGKPSSFRNISVVGVNKYLDTLDNSFCSYRGNVSKAKFDGSNFNREVMGGFMVVDGDLTGSSFRGASLKSAVFSRSNLTGADFTNANLEGADFEGANLTSVNFTGANLDGANLAGAILCETIDPKGTMLYFGCE